MLAKGSDVKCLTLAKDGTLYAYANPVGTANRLFKSKDNGVSWSFTGDVTSTIIDIAAASDDAAFIYYATTSAVFRSSDYGATFIQLPPNPGGAGASNIEITSIDVAAADRGRTIAAATRDRDAGQFGGVYTLDENNPFTWQDTSAGPFDVFSIAFSPDYLYDRRMVAVVNNEADTFAGVKIGTGGWGASAVSARLSRNNASPVVSLPSVQTACIAFPDGASGEPSRGTGAFFIGINTGTGTGDVYRIDSPDSASLTATDLNAGPGGSGNIDVGAIAATGLSPDLKLFAGSAQDTRVFTSSDGGKNWNVCVKTPTGNAITGIIPAGDFAPIGQLFSATSGTESAFSVSRDAGLTWNQVGLIDTQIAANDIVDIVASPDYAGDNTLFLLAAGTKYGLYRSQEGTGWERVLSGTLPGVDSLGGACLTPAYGKDHRVIYVSGVSGGAPALWRSGDAGEKWTRTPAPFNIYVMAILDDKTVFIGGQSGGSAFVAMSDNGGLVFGPKVSCGTAVLKSLALSPNYLTDRTIIAGNGDGWVYCSSEGGVSFKPVPPDASTRPLSGTAWVAFDSGFAKNRIIYAASNTLNSGVFRFTLNKSQIWEKIDSTLPTASSIAQIGVSTEGTIYAINITQSTK